MGKSQVPRGSASKDKSYRKSDFNIEKSRSGDTIDKSKRNMKFNVKKKRK